MTEAKTAEPLAAIPDHIEEQARAVLDAACDKDLSIVTAESCTGGLLASLLTDVEGKSHAFERGFVAYAKEAKCELLGIEAELIDQCTAVSKDVAEAMARGALANSHGDVAISITGYAGPAAEGKEEGLVHFGCLRRGGEMAHREEHFGAIGRGPVRQKSLEVALDMLAEAVG